MLALIVVVLEGVMAFEHLTNGWNPYALLGCKAQYFAADLSRDGHVRSTATFGTPILAGTFGAVLLPVFIGLWMTDRRQRGAALLGAICTPSSSSLEVIRVHQDLHISSVLWVFAFGQSAT